MRYIVNKSLLKGYNSFQQFLMLIWCNCNNVCFLTRYTIIS